MTSVGVFEAKARLSRLIDEVCEGKTVTITRHGRPVARLVAAGGEATADRRRLVAEIKRSRRSRKTPAVDLRKLAREGRD